MSEGKQEKKFNLECRGVPVDQESQLEKAVKVMVDISVQPDSNDLASQIYCNYYNNKVCTVGQNADAKTSPVCKYYFSSAPKGGTTVAKALHKLRSSSFNPDKFIEYISKRLSPLSGITVHTPTKEDFQTVLRLYEAKGWRWTGGFAEDGFYKPTEGKTLWLDYKEETCLPITNYFYPDSKRLCQNNNITVYSIDEFLHKFKIDKNDLAAFNFYLDREEEF